MTKASGLGARFLIDGYSLANDVGAVSRIGCPVGQMDVTGLDRDAHERIFLIRDGGIDYTPFFNPATGRIHDVLSALPRTPYVVTYVHRNALDAPAASIYGHQINYDPTRGADGSLMFSASHTGAGYGLEWGELLTAGIVTSTAAENLASRDDGAATTFGLQAYLHVLGFTGTSVTVTVQDSADNSSFAAVTGAAFTAASAIGSQRIATAVDATIRRYLRVALTGSYSSAVLAVNVVRNLTATRF